MLGLENAIFQQTTKWLCGQCYSSHDVGGVLVDLSKGDVKENLVVQLQLTEQGLKTHHRFLIGVIIFTEYQADFVQHRAKLCLIFGTSFFKKNKIFPSAGMFPHAGHTVLLLLHFPTSTSSLSPKRSNFNEKICNFTDLLDDCLKYQFEEQALNIIEESGGAVWVRGIHSVVVAEALLNTLDIQDKNGKVMEGNSRTAFYA